MKEQLKKFLEKLKVIPLLSIGAALWKIGGSGAKYTRRFILPAVIAGIYFWKTHDILGTLLTYGFAMTFTEGYGIPDKSWVDMGLGDSGSTIARFWLKFTKDLKAVRFLTRFTVGVSYSTIMIPLVFQHLKSPYDMLGLAVTIPLIVHIELGEIEEALIGMAVMWWYCRGII